MHLQTSHGTIFHRATHTEQTVHSARYFCSSRHGYVFIIHHVPHTSIFFTSNGSSPLPLSDSHGT